MVTVMHPVCDLNNFLQGQPEGNATKKFQRLLTREGPEHGTILRY